MGRIYPVGYLDYLDEGVMLLTNNGDMAKAINLAEKDINSVYACRVFGVMPPEMPDLLKKG